MRSAKPGPDEDTAAKARGRLPPLSMVRAFEAVSRLGSMRKAAEDINLSHTVISRHVRNLEAWLGTRLVEAGPRGVSLTPEGKAFARSVGAAFDLMAKATSELRPARHSSVLRIWCVPGLATRWLMPRFHQLQQAMPSIEFVIRATDLEPDFAHHEADICIRYSDGPKGTLHWVLLERTRMFPVASPGWIARHPSILRPEDLVGQPLIHEENHDQWRQWFRAVGCGDDIRLNGPRLWSANLTLDAAATGQGIALATRLIAADDLETGRLVELLKTDIRPGGYYLAAPPERWNEPVLKQFRVWMEQAIATTGGCDAPAAHCQW